MTTLAVIFGILILFALLRFGVSVEYSAAGFTVAIKAGPLSFPVFPRKEKPENAKKEAKRKARKEEKARKKAEKKADKKAKKKTEEKKPGAISTVLEILPAVKKLLGRLRHRLLIKQLIIYYTIAGDDPSKTALIFGTANAAIAAILPGLESAFRIKRRDIQVLFDFIDTKQKIYINAAISLAMWEAVYIVFAVIPAVIKILLNSKEKPITDRKDRVNDGKDSDK